MLVAEYILKCHYLVMVKIKIKRGKTKMTKENIQNTFAWGWKKFAGDFLELYGQEQNPARIAAQSVAGGKKSSQKSVVASIIVAFLIVFITAQALNFVNNFVENKYLLEKYKGANVIIYSNIS